MKSDKSMDKSGSKAEFDSTEFEKRLTNLKDTQDSIQALSAWCLQNRVHHKKVVTSWLVVLKQGKISFSRTNKSVQHKISSINTKTINFNGLKPHTFQLICSEF